MTRRLYFDDAYARTFKASILEQTIVDERPALILDQTAFYPTGGGQPHDTGMIDGVPVVDVVMREDGAILHVLDGEPPTGTVTGEIDWQRRLDHMQQHTGQHILSAAFIESIKAPTIGFHLGSEFVTIDLDTPHLSYHDTGTTEDLANLVVMSNMDVRAWFPNADELAGLEIRSGLADVSQVRIVQIADLDATGCGGTHVARTGEIGLIKILKTEKRGDSVRVTFLCGWRALKDYSDKHETVSALANQLTVGTWEVEDAIQRLEADYKALRSAYNQSHGALLDYLAQSLQDSADERGGVKLIRCVLDPDDGYDAKDLNKLAATLTQTPGTVALLGLAGEKCQFVMARGDDLPHNMVSALEAALATLGTTRGGGRPAYASGGGVQARVAQVDAALQEADAALFAD